MQYFIQELSAFDEARIQECLAWFPPALAEAIRQIANSSRRREKVAAYSVLVDAMKSMALYRELPIIDYAESGKPYLANYPDLHFNLSHCSRYVAVAIDSDSPVGIDVECRRKVSPSLIRRVCSEAEQQIIAAAADPDLEFLRLWTRKEAYLKYTGTGIVEPLANIPPQETKLNTPVAEPQTLPIILNSHPTVHSSQLTTHNPQVTGHRSQVSDHQSQVTSHSSQLTGHTINTHPLPDGDGWVSVCWGK